MKKIVQAGATTYRATCSECGCVFTYEREDVRHYVRGGEHVSCPSCGHDCRHFGRGGGSWPTWTGKLQCGARTCVS